HVERYESPHVHCYLLFLGIVALVSLQWLFQQARAFVSVTLAWLAQLGLDVAAAEMHVCTNGGTVQIVLFVFATQKVYPQSLFALLV
ncbi:hypothetical protein CWC25_22540, partial [Pseudoalteromonas sp. S4389]